ncbi:POTRA domain-containing protein [candidate division KSB1 bacterium]
MKFFLVISIIFFTNHSIAFCDIEKFDLASGNSLFDTIRSLPDSIFIDKIVVSGNKRTKEKIIIREITFERNQYYKADQLKDLIEESRENLINTSLFNFVIINIHKHPKQPDQINISINVMERWYTWVFPILEFKERNFNTWWKLMDYTKVNYGLSFLQENIRGRREELELDVSLGFDEMFKIAYQFPSINKQQTIGMGFGYGYKRNHEVFYKTEQNELQYFKDEIEYTRKDQFAAIFITLRKGIHNTHTFQFQVDQLQIADTIIQLNPNYTFKDQDNLSFVSFYYKYKNDYRDYKHYPLEGHYFDIELINHGFGILKNKGLNVFYILTNYRKFWNLKKRFYYAAGFTGKISANTFQPYILQFGLGFNNHFIRGYEYYVIDGQHFAIIKSNFKYEILPTKVKTISFIPIKKFKTIHYAAYLNLFADMAYVDDNTFKEGNNLNNTLIFGTGIGLDFVTYYDNVLRLEYAFNKMKESGIFIHFTAPI